jgi:quercetin dioxygenase-like cupin family protein
MKTLSMSQEEMNARIARFAELQSWRVQSDNRIPQEARDLIYARRLVTVAVPEGLQGPFANAAAIRGTDFSMTIAICPPGQGPGLHTHAKTTETFTCLSGRFRVYWGDHGEHDTILEELDTISVPPRVVRGFENAGETEGYLQVLITGGVHDMNDIALRPSLATQLKAYGPEVLEEVSRTGIRFDAGLDEERGPHDGLDGDADTRRQ